MKKIKNLLWVFTAIFIYSSCGNEFEINKEAIEYLTFDETSNWQISLNKPLTEEAYEAWKYKIME